VDTLHGSPKLNIRVVDHRKSTQVLPELAAQKEAGTFLLPVENTTERDKKAHLMFLTYVSRKTVVDSPVAMVVLGGRYRSVFFDVSA